MAAPEAPLLYQGVSRTSAAFRLLKQMGWQEGEGLGKEKQGITEHVRVAKRKDNAGVGVDAQQKAASNWTFNTATFDSILKNLNVIVADSSQGDVADNGKEKEIAPHDSKQGKKATRPQGRYKKRELGKVLQGKSQADLDAILGYGMKSPREVWPAFDGSKAKSEKTSFSEPNCVPSERLAEVNDTTSALCSPALVKDEHLEETPAVSIIDWWGTNYGFVRAGGLGQETHDAKDGKETTGLEATHSTKIRMSFCEQDQEDLYKLVQDKATKGRQGLGKADRPKKIGGAHWKGQKVNLDINEDNADEEGVLDVQNLGTGNVDPVLETDQCRQKADLEREDERKVKRPRQEYKLKWKKLCRQLLLEAPAQTMKIRDLHRLIVEKIYLYTDGNFDDCKPPVGLLKEKFKEKLIKSSKFVIEGKKVSLAISS